MHGAESRFASLLPARFTTECEMVTDFLGGQREKNLTCGAESDKNFLAGKFIGAVISDAVAFTEKRR